MKHIAIRIRGKVQGVFYRASTEQQARTLGVNGFVRNEADGSVYVEAEGEEQAVDALALWCRQGPPRATVEQVDITEIAPRNFTDFVQRR
ncbi:acylphosphatase [Chryseolinea sp. Jin1]|uniref:acylphosphatase n=2 Tax=Chryseolinea lacunae TaxID=2801331 RepID=A0ABS1KSG5_9BACT|nr:acylphosphatase [Chryseolinea lacunae]